MAPLLIVYEVGVLLLGVQNGADAFMRRLLECWVSGSISAAHPDVCILLGWHSFRASPGNFPAALSRHGRRMSVVGSLPAGDLVDAERPGRDEHRRTIKEAVGFLGAGIYEELLFRLILLSLVAWAFRHAGTPRVSMILAVLLSSLLFAAAHHIGPHGECGPCPLSVSLSGGGFLFDRIPLSRVRHRRRQPRRVRHPQGVALGLNCVAHSVPWPFSGRRHGGPSSAASRRAHECCHAHHCHERCQNATSFGPLR